MENRSKVPAITIFFWIIKILTTAMGESTSDYLVTHIDPVVAVALGGIGLVVAFVLQFSVRRYIAWVYWFTVIMVAIFGTMAADVLHIGLGISYIASSTFFVIALVVIFSAWYISERTLSIHSVYTRRREGFYWATVLATFALGTAVGDLTAATFGLGYLHAGLLFAALIAVIAIIHFVSRARSDVLAFWLVYILTRPLGASFADWAGKSPSIGGLGFGDGMVSFILLVLIVAFVGFVAASRRDVRA